jgi:hypothetical protein
VIRPNFIIHTESLPYKMNWKEAKLTEFYAKTIEPVFLTKTLTPVIPSLEAAPPSSNKVSWDTGDLVTIFAANVMLLFQEVNAFDSSTTMAVDRAQGCDRAYLHDVNLKRVSETGRQGDRIFSEKVRNESEFHFGAYMRRLIEGTEGYPHYIYVFAIDLLGRVSKSRLGIRLRPFNYQRLIIASIAVAANHLRNVTYSRAQLARLGGIQDECNRTGSAILCELEVNLLTRLRGQLEISLEMYCKRQTQCHTIASLMNKNIAALLTDFTS